MSFARSVGRFFDVEPPGLDLREVEHVVDQIEQLRAAPGDRLERLALCGVQAAVALQELRVAEHAVQRRSQLVAHVGQELALGARRRLGRLLRAAELGVALAAIGDVPEKRAEEEAVLDVHRRRDGELDRELASRPVQGRQLEALVDDRRLAGFVEAPHPVVVRLAKRRRNDRLGQVPAERPRRASSRTSARPARSRRRCCPSESMPMKASCAVSTMSRARASLSARRASALRRSSSAMATTMRLATEIAKFCSSTVQALAPPTCSAQSTPTVRVVVPQRHVEHRADVVRDQVAVEELAGARIGPGVVGGDDALALEGLEVVGGVAAVQDGARFVLARRARDTGPRTG